MGLDFLLAISKTDRRLGTSNSKSFCIPIREHVSWCQSTVLAPAAEMHPTRPVHLASLQVSRKAFRLLLRGDVSIDSLGADPVRLLQPSRSRPHEDPTSERADAVPSLDIALGASVQPAPFAGAFPHIHLFDDGTVVGLSSKGQAGVWPSEPPNCPGLAEAHVARGSVLAIRDSQIPPSLPASSTPQEQPNALASTLPPSTELPPRASASLSGKQRKAAMRLRSQPWPRYRPGHASWLALKRDAAIAASHAAGGGSDQQSSRVGDAPSMDPARADQPAGTSTPMAAAPAVPRIGAAFGYYRQGSGASSSIDGVGGGHRDGRVADR